MRLTLSPTRNPLIEGSEEERRSYIDGLARERRVEVARAQRDWREFHLADLMPRASGRLLADEDGHLWQRVRSPVFTSNKADDGSPRISLWNEHTVRAFYVHEGDVIPLEPGTPRTVIQLDIQEARHRSRRSEQRIAELTRQHEVAAFRKTEPRRTVTLGDLQARDDLPTIAAAAQRILDLAGTIEMRDGHLVIERPERFSDGGQEHEQLEAEFNDAVRVLVAAGDVVLKAVQSTSKKPLSERLPDKQAAAGGGIA